MTLTTTFFPAVYQGLPTAELLEAYVTGPARLRRALKGLSLDQLRARPRPNKWTIMEIALHVTDSELMGAGRIRFALAEPGAPVIGYDQDRWAAALEYQSADLRSLERSLDLFTAIREVTTGLFRRAKPSHWDSTVSHPRYGAVTLRNLLELYADHSERHVGQIVDLRGLLDKPLDLPPLLQLRLY